MNLREEKTHDFNQVHCTSRQLDSEVSMLRIRSLCGSFLVLLVCLITVEAVDGTGQICQLYAPTLEKWEILKRDARRAAKDLLVLWPAKSVNNVA
jgi:hypothetical protein